MPKQELIKPEFQQKGFTCPHCNYNSNHVWIERCFTGWNYNGLNGTQPPKSYFVYAAQCNHCDKFSFWYKGKMIYPDIVLADEPNEDMPKEIQVDYREAASILNKSPRASAALLRLTIEKICKHLGKNDTIDKMIADLVSDGLSVQVQQSLDIVRVIGNEGVHAGQIDLRDDIDTVYTLFKLVNFICDEMITKPKFINENFNNLPQSKIDAITRRDNIV